MKQKLIKWIIKKLQLRYWGVARESDMPPEFVITKHAAERLDERVVLSHALTHEQWTIIAWHDGKEATKAEARADTHKELHSFHKTVYKKHGRYIYVFGIFYTRQGWAQKWLVTVYWV